MRLFIAAELPQGLIEALAETSARLRGSVRGRYVSSDSFHVTLAFLGDVPGSSVGLCADAVDAACQDRASFPVALGSLGCFGKRATATLWQGFDDAGALPDIALAVREELRVRGFSFDEKKFLAHVTLMRKADVSGGMLPTPVLASGPIFRITLFASDLSGDRPVYESLHSRTLRE